MPELTQKEFAVKVIEISTREDAGDLGIAMGGITLECEANILSLAADYLRLLALEERREYMVAYERFNGVKFINVEYRGLLSLTLEDAKETVAILTPQAMVRNVRLMSRRPAGEWKEEKQP